MKPSNTPSRTLKADAARFRWWLKLWNENTDEAMDIINDVVSLPEGEANICAAIDAAIKRRRK